MPKPCKGCRENEANHFEQLGVQAAETYEPIVLKQAQDDGVTLPLMGGDVAQLLDNTISGLERGGSIVWAQTREAMRDVFMRAWYETMARKGIF